MRGKTLEQVDLPDGMYPARIGGNTIRIKTSDKVIRVKADKDSGAISVAVWVKIKEKTAIFSSRYWQ